MTKQQEIQEGLEELMRSAVGSSWAGLETDNILNYLHSKGVVIKVDRELPLSPMPPTPGDALIYRTQKDMLKAGYVAVEELIEKD